MRHDPSDPDTLPQDEQSLLMDILKLDELRWSLLLERKVAKANFVSDQLFQLERNIPLLPDKGRKLLEVMAASPACEIRNIAAWHLIPIDPARAEALLADLSQNASNVQVQLVAWTTLNELIAGRINYAETMRLS